LQSAFVSATYCLQFESALQQAAMEPEEGSHCAPVAAYWLMQLPQPVEHPMFGPFGSHPRKTQ
jgi:hypothetical protein